MSRRVEVRTARSADTLTLLESVHPGGALSDEAYTWIAANSTRFEASVDGDEIVWSAEYQSVPYFGWVFDRPQATAGRKTLNHFSRQVDAARTGAAMPEAPKRGVFEPPVDMTPDQVRTVATLAFLLAIVEYANSLFTQTVDYVAHTFDATNAQLGTVTAVARVGNLLVLIGGVLTDRVGRRRLLLVAVSIVLGATALCALTPSLSAFAALQVLVSGATNLAFMVAFIAAVEEAPEGGRTYTIALVGIAAGLGFAIGAILLPAADLADDAWRGMFALAAIGFLLLPGASRRLHETRRFEALLARNAQTGRVGEVVDQKYGGRFVLLCVAGFLVNVFFAPQSQFTNRYLGDERGFSGLGILGLRALTQTIPALAAAYLGGQLAETKGRRPIAVQGLVVGSLATAAFFVVGGPMLWALLAIGTAGQSLSGPALSAFSTELFPTEVRGTAGAGLTITSVIGSAAGLLLAGFLSEPLGSIGSAVAVTSIAPLIVAVFLIRHLPEAKGRLLEDVSPSEV